MGWNLVDVHLNRYEYLYYRITLVSIDNSLFVVVKIAKYFFQDLWPNVMFRAYLKNVVNFQGLKQINIVQFVSDHLVSSIILQKKKIL